MTTAITRIGELIQKFAGNPAQSKSSVQATIVYEILYLLEQENFFPKDLLEQLRKQCSNRITNTKTARVLFDALHLKLTGRTYYKKKKVRSPINPVAEKWYRRISGAEARIFEYVTHSDTITQEDRLAIFLFSAAANGGLCHAPGLNSLLRTVIEKAIDDSQAVLTQAGAERYFRLKYSASGHPVNVKNDDERYNTHVFYPHPLTTAALIGLLRNSHTKNYKTDNAVERIKDFLAEILNDRELKKVTNQRLTDALSLLFFRQEGGRVPVFIQHYAAGRANNASTFDECLLSLNTRHCITKRTRPVTKKDGKILNKRDLQTTSDALLYEIADIYRRFAGRDDESTLIENALIQLRDQSQFSAKAAKPMLNWFIWKFQAGKWTCGASGKRTLSCLGKIWLYLTENIGAEGLEGLDQTDCSLLYTKLRAFESGADSTFPSTLRHFWLYMHNHLGFEIPEQLADFVSGTKFVRCAIPGSHQIRQLLIDTAEAYSHSTQHVIETVTAMTLLMARLGLRPDEAINLEVSDIDLRGDGLVFIRPNEHFNLKTYSAQRTLPLMLFLMPDEEEFIRHYCRRRQLETTERTNALLFSEYELADTFINYDTLSANITRLLSDYLNVHTNTYQLRHYALTTCQLICCASSERAQQLTGYSAEQIAAIRRYFNGADHDDVLSEIAEFAGHLNTETSTSTYFHLTDLLRFEAAMSGSQKYDVSFITKLTSLQGGRLRRLAQENGGTEMLDNKSLLAVLDDVFKTERTHWVKYLRPQNTPKKSKVPTFNTNTKRSAEYVEKILHMHDHGVSNNELADVYNLDICWINEVIQAAYFYRDDPRFQTGENKPRLYSEEASSGLTIAMPATNIQKLESVDILQRLKELQGVTSNRAAKAANIILEKTTNNRTYIRLDSRAELRKIAKGLDGVVLPDRWLLKVHVKQRKEPEDSEKLNYWRTALPAGATIKIINSKDANESRYGKAHLSYRDSTLSEQRTAFLKTRGVEDGSSRAMLSALHKYMIFMRAEEQYCK
ncbi:UNVERIFIED_ORG: phage integrase family protein [Idiomarina abyssalis]|uniref:site-specific integrase n=1 Tax=unclassified Idiomarina TaxID=2614829 RepID=UPI000E0F2DCE|nr:site-specific integrase [Idiomarina sp. 017G]TDO50977.1 phage integrase family protein [Idiomarina sp. 017G]